MQLVERVVWADQEDSPPLQNPADLSPESVRDDNSRAGRWDLERGRTQGCFGASEMCTRAIMVLVRRADGQR